MPSPFEEVPVGSVTVRQLSTGVVDQVKLIAASNGRSMECELRMLIVRFVDLPVESCRELLPLAVLPLPVWYEGLWEYRTLIGATDRSSLPKRVSAFRAAIPVAKY